MEIEDKKLQFVETLKPFLDKYGAEMLNDFFEYWTEPSRNGKKLRIDGEKYFCLSRRLATWYKLSKNKYGKQPYKVSGTDPLAELRQFVSDHTKPEQPGADSI